MVNYWVHTVEYRDVERSLSKTVWMVFLFQAVASTSMCTPSNFIRHSPPLTLVSLSTSPSSPCLITFIIRSDKSSSCYSSKVNGKMVTHLGTHLDQLLFREHYSILDLLDVLLQDLPPLYQWPEVQVNTHAWLKSTHLSIRVSPLKYTMSKMNKQQQASLNADF